MKVGSTDVLDIRVGSTGASKVFLGATEVWTATPFNPATLFASGEEGAWFERFDQTAFLSITDLTQAVVTDGVGFGLSKNAGAGYSGGAFTGLGSEQVTNGAFDTVVSGWSGVGGASVSWNSGRLSVDAAPGDTYGAARATLSLDVGKTYIFSIDFVSNSAAENAPFVVRDTSLSNTYAYTATTAPNTTVEFAFTALEANVEILLTVLDGGGTGGSSLWDNVSVRELPGNHATQITAPSRPILRQTAGGVFYLEEGPDDVLNWTAPAGTYTIAYVNTAGTVTILTGQALSGATNILQDPELVAYLAVNRTLTAGETSGLTTYLEGVAA